MFSSVVAERGLPQALLEFRGDGGAVEKDHILPLIRQDEVQSFMLDLGQLGIRLSSSFSSSGRKIGEVESRPVLRLSLPGPKGRSPGGAL